MIDRKEFPRLQTGVRIRHNQPLEGIDTGIIIVRSGGELFVACEHPEHGRFDIQIYVEEVVDILEQGCVVPLSQERLDRMIALSKPETLERKCARNIAKRELQWGLIRKTLKLDADGGYQLA